MYNLYIIYMYYNICIFIYLICCKFMNPKPIYKFGLNNMKLLELCYFCY